ncbi:putative membrane-associated virion core protein (p39) [Eptesipox virus]|uniref:39kDa core protein OPG130 n=1 Tax=Eptesipox virus TaxID=1329402 RepID=A0A220T6F5_9POXV|nr:putative membrane-associated virion core protein (p39) [Eptesipox virus]ASK51301.1 putative membrane-associated virion core protein (p39) [Eptesipox virus]WAH71059.1 putative membrane-associated virion core protein (p39) [Eptesipox virus]
MDFMQKFSQQLASTVKISTEDENINITTEKVEVNPLPIKNQETYFQKMLIEQLRSRNQLKINPVCFDESIYTPKNSAYDTRPLLPMIPNSIPSPPSYDTSNSLPSSAYDFSPPQTLIDINTDVDTLQSTDINSTDNCSRSAQSNINSLIGITNTKTDSSQNSSSNIDIARELKKALDDHFKNNTAAVTNI